MRYHEKIMGRANIGNCEVDMIESTIDEHNEFVGYMVRCKGPMYHINPEKYSHQVMDYYFPDATSADMFFTYLMTSNVKYMTFGKGKE